MIRNANPNRQTILLSALMVLLFAAAVAATYNNFTRPYPGMNDFMSRWEGARSYWVEGLNPYGDAASLNIQQQIYGRPVTATEDPGFFAYPFYTVFLLAPVVTVSYAWASAFWMVLLAACLIGALFLLLDLFRWRPPPLLLGALVLFALLMYFAARGLLLGQPGHLVYFLEVLAIWGLARERDGLAGVALAVSTVKPQMGYLLVPFLLLWALRGRRWRFIGAFVVAFGGLMLASFVLLPTWLGDWLFQVGLYPTYTQIGGPVWVLTHYPWLGINEATGLWEVRGGFGDVLETIVAGLGYALLLWTWYAVLVQGRQERLLWTISMTLLITHLVAPRTASPHFVVFMLPLIFYLRALTQRRGGGVWAWGLLAALFVLPWLHFLLTVAGEFEHPTIYLPVPMVLLVVLWVTRRMWWRDPRDVLQHRFIEVGGAS